MTDLDALEYPRWLHHLFLEPVLVATLEDALELPGGYREVPYAPEDREEAHARSVEVHAQRKAEARERLRAAVEEPVTPLPEVPKPPPPKRKRIRNRAKVHAPQPDAPPEVPASAPKRKHVRTRR